MKLYEILDEKNLKEIKETASAGATAAGAVASVPQSFGITIKRPDQNENYVNQTIIGPDGKPKEEEKDSEN